MGGIQTKGLGGVFQGVSACGSFIRVGDVGGEPLHGTGPGELPEQGLQGSNGDVAEAMGVWKLGVPTAGDINGGGGF